ncbi:MAG: ABC-2 family transporter protein [Pirellulaceae bacterium]|nr:ABC-2 family transporter protein [Pirellulaceae bacterium]
MSFRNNFWLELIAASSWVVMNLGFYILVYQHTEEIGQGSGWHFPEFLCFLATTTLITSVVQAFFMPNAQEFSELIRTGGLDFVLLKPIDTQFLVSFRKVSWSSLGNFVFALGLLGYSVWKMTTAETDPLVLSPIICLLYPLFVLLGIVMMYSLMMILAATSIWLGRNQTLYDFWFYITNFSRYPKEIYSGAWGLPLQYLFLFVVPILLVVNVPARMLAAPFRHQENPGLWYVEWYLPIFMVGAAVVSLSLSRAIFQWALRSYRSSSS